jgi:hypothetical protein
MDTDLLRAIADLGCQSEGDLPAVLDCLEGILSNLQDRRRPDAVAVLESMTRTGVGQSLRIAQLLARHAPAEGPNNLAQAYRYLNNTDDPQWSQEIERLTVRPPQRGMIAEFSKRLTTIFDNRLRQCDPAERRALLTKHSDLFTSAITALGTYLLPNPRVMLTNWIAEAGMVRQKELLGKALATRSPGCWDEVHRSVTTLQDSTYMTAEAAVSAEETLAQVNSYRRWRRQFNRLLETLSHYEFTQPPLFPWSPQANPSVGINPVQLTESVSGLDQWGDANDRAAWTQVAQDLSNRGRQALTSTETPSPVDALTGLLALKAQWTPLLIDIPEPVQWDEAERRLRTAVEDSVADLLAQLRNRFESGPVTLQALEAHPQFKQLEEFAGPLLQQFRDDLERLRKAERDLDHWWELGDTDVLYDSRIKGLEEDLEALSACWGQAPGLRRCRDHCSTVHVELQRLDEAKQQFRNGHAEAALEILNNCTSPAHTVITENARKQVIDERIRTAVSRGDFAHITEFDLNAASPEIRALHKQCWQGHQFVEDLDKRCAELAATGPLKDFGRDLLELRAQQPPPDTVLAKCDSAALERIRRELRERFFRKADSLVEVLRTSLRHYPLLDNFTLTGLEERLTDLTDAMLLPGLADPDRYEVDRLSETLIPFRKVLHVHRACIDRDWDSAAAQLADSDIQQYLDHNEQRKLSATLRTSRLQSEQSSDSAWLDAYRELPDVLIGQEQDRNRYLQLLRQVTPAEPQKHRAILERWLPQESYLASLLGCFDDPLLTCDIEGLPHAADEPVFVRLLQHLTQSPTNYRPLQRLWNLLPPDVQARLWTGPESPVDEITHLIRATQDDILRRLVSAGAKAAELKTELDRLASTGQTDAQTVAMLDAAARIEAQLRDFDRHDPWAPELRPALEQTRRDLGYLSPAIIQVHGWDLAVERRIEGIRVWDDLATAWEEFSRRFNSRFLGFYNDSTPWTGFQDLLRHWLNNIDQAIVRGLGDTNWEALDGCRSQRWLDLLKIWSQSPEGLLWIEQQRPLPGALSGLRSVYHSIAEQLTQFSVLHTRLLAGVNEVLLAELRDLHPLSRPVDEVRRQLTNPEVAYKIGTAYQRFIAELDRSTKFSRD